MRLQWLENNTPAIGTPLSQVPWFAIGVKLQPIFPLFRAKILYPARQEASLLS
uniref:Uncharacterized protein n=1 Tax=Anguilla anguilla TaxID=7936 RepID=A0A0E9PJD1_ANGAN